MVSLIGYNLLEVKNMEDMVKMLADAPEEQREMMLTERLKMIGGQPLE